jgi:diaminopimelate epimerase
MNTLQLVKHHGLGNDFLIGFHVDLPERELSDLARRVCDRRRGVGADGLLIGESHPDASAEMVLFNADGGRAEISGNGLRCFAHALARRRRDIGTVQMTIATDAGFRLVDLEPTDDPATMYVTAAMGEVVAIAAPTGWAELGVDPARPAAHLSVGNPHTVVAVDDLHAVDLDALGHSLPAVNLEIIVAGPTSDSITMRVHERGVGITEACGSGACAAAVAAKRWGLAAPNDGKLLVQMDGGRASVGIEEDAAGATTASLSSPTAYVATIEYRVQ